MSDPVDVVTLAEAQAYLNITVSTYDFELAGFITAASRLWTQRVGPVNSTAYDETYDGGRTRIVLRRAPVLTVTSVVESWGAISYTLTESYGTWSYSLDHSTGLLTRRTMGTAVPFAPGQRNVEVSYTAGYATPPADIKHAVLLLILHLWETQRGGARRIGQGGTDDWRPDFAFSWPSRVEAIAASYLAPAIA